MTYSYAIASIFSTSSGAEDSERIFMLLAQRRRPRPRPPRWSGVDSAWFQSRSASRRHRSENELGGQNCPSGLTV